MEAAAAVRTPAPDQLIERVQELQQRLDASSDSATREVADELVGAIMEMYALGLERIVESLVDAGDDGQRLAAGLVDDPLVATLLLIHDLHPVPLRERVQGALDSVRPYMESHGGNVELLSLEDGVARIHLQGSCSDCSASSVTLELAIKQALEDAAPDLEGLEVEGVAPQMTGLGLPMAEAPESSGMELPVVMSSPAPAAPSWFEVAGAGELGEGLILAVSVAGLELAIANVGGTLLAYRDKCANCGAAIHDGELSGGAVSCPGCKRSFFLPRAGRSLDGDQMQLEPVPLLREQGSVKVAIAG